MVVIFKVNFVWDKYYTNILFNITIFFFFTMIQLFDFNLGDNEDERVNVEIIKQNTIEREDIMNDGYVD